MTSAQRLTLALTILNLIVLVTLLARGAFDYGEPDDAILRGRGLELIDSTGEVRAEFKVEPDGEAVFRMRDSEGAIRVKLGAGRDGSGLVLLDESTEPGVHLVARRSATSEPSTTTSISLIGADGKRHVIAP